MLKTYKHTFEVSYDNAMSDFGDKRIGDTITVYSNSSDQMDTSTQNALLREIHSRCGTPNNFHVDSHESEFSR